MWISSVFAVVLNWNLAPDTAACIKSLEGAGLPLPQLILVDNGSTDDSLDELVRTFGGRIKYAPSAENLGFAGGTNIGIRYALQAGADWVLLINNDTFVSPTFLEELAAAVQARPDWRILSPMILYAGEPDVIWSLGDRRIGPTLLTYGFLRNRRAPNDLPAYLNADSVNACAMLVHRDVFARIGGFDETYFMYAEDADFCWRAQQAGFQMGAAARARMWHKVSRSTGIYHPQSRYWRVHNQIRFYQERGRGWQKWLLFGFTAARTLLMTTQDVGAGRFSLIRTTWRAWCDGWCGQ
jgi:GT2 family glycosyltransferase